MTKVRFDQIAKEVRNTFSGDKAGVPIVGLEHIIPNELLLSDHDIDTENTFTKAFKKGQILFGRRRAYQQKAAVATFDGICSGDITVIEPIDGAVCPELLPFIIQNERFFEHAVRGSAGSLSPRVKWEHLSSYEIELPSYEEQVKLANTLWAAYNLKTSYKTLLTSIDEMVKSQFNEMFKGCKMTQLKKVACFSKASINPIKGVKYTLFSFPAFDNNCIPEFVDGGEIKSSKIKLEDNVILYNKLNVRLSRVWNINELSSNNNVCSSEFLPVKVTDKDLITKSFLYRILCSEDVTKKMVACSTGTSNSQKRITPASLLSLDIPIPSMEEQMKFVAIAEQADKSKFELKKSIEAIDKVIKSLINNI